MLNSKLIAINCAALAVLISLVGYQTIRADNYRSQLNSVQQSLELTIAQNHDLHTQIVKNREAIEQYQQQQKKLISALEQQQEISNQIATKLDEELNREDAKNWRNQPVPAGISRLFKRQNRVSSSAEATTDLPDNHRMPQY